MRTVRSLASAADRRLLWSNFPAKKLALGLVLLTAAAAVYALVDRVAPPPPKPPPEQARPAAEKPRKDAVRADVQPFSLAPMAAMAGVLAGAVGLAFVLKRVLRGSRHVPGGKKILAVRDVLAIGPKRAIYLIGLERRNLVVGACGDTLTLLSEYSDDGDAASEAPAPARESMLAAPAPAPAATAAFAAAASGAPSRLEVVAGDEIAVPPPEPPAAPQGLRATRAFPFASVKAQEHVRANARADRVPHKFRQLLEQAAVSEGPAR